MSGVEAKNRNTDGLDGWVPYFCPIKLETTTERPMESNSESDGEGLQLMNGKSVQRTKEKTDIAVAQKQLVDELVDFRVKMQNLLVLVNRLPQVSSGRGR